MVLVQHAICRRFEEEFSKITFDHDSSTLLLLIDVIIVVCVV